RTLAGARVLTLSTPRASMGIPRRSARQHATAGAVLHATAGAERPAAAALHAWPTPANVRAPALRARVSGRGLLCEHHLPSPRRPDSEEPLHMTSRRCYGFVGRSPNLFWPLARNVHAVFTNYT